MYKEYLGKLEEVDIQYAGVRYTGFLCVGHVSGAHLVVLRKESSKGDKVLAFLVRGEVDVHGAVILAEEYRGRWGIENAFRSLEEFRGRTRTCDVRKELTLVLLSYLVLNLWFSVRSWVKVKLWVFCESLAGLLDLEGIKGLGVLHKSVLGLLGSFTGSELALCTSFYPREINCK